MPTSSFTGGSAGSGINKNVNNVIYVQDKGNKDITGYANIYGDVQVYNQKKDAPLAYLYVKFDSDSFQDFEYIYVFRTNDGGATREVIPLTLIGNTLSLFVGSPGDGIPNVSYSRYRSGLGLGNPYANTTPPTYNASLVFDPLYTYYICIFTANDTLNLDFQAYISASDSAEGFSYINLLPNTNDEGNDVTWKIVLDSSAWTRETLLAGSSISNKADSETPSVVFSIDSSDGSTSIDGDVIIAGDLTVNGTTTTINTTNLSVEDTIIELNRNGTLSVDMGFLFSKSVDPKPVFYWNSLYNNRFDLALVTGATATSTNLHSLSQTPTALNMGALTATTGSFSSTLGVTGATTLGNNVQINWASGTTRTFQIQKTGLAYPYFYVNNSGNLMLGGTGATAQFLANIDATYGTSNFYTTNISGHLTIDTDQQIKFKKPTNTATTSAILFNSDRTGASQEADIICLEVERGTLTNAQIKWDETYNWWFLSNTVSTEQLKTSDIQAEVGTFNYSGGYENEDIVLYVKNTSLNNSFTITGGGDVFANGQISTNMPSLSTTPAILLNADRSGPGEESSVIALSVNRGEEISSNIKWDETNDRWDFNYGLYLNTDSQLKIEKPSTPSTTPAILLNADRTGVGQEADVIAIEVERGTDTNSYIKWDESNNRWEISSGLNVIGNTDFQNSVSLLSDVYIGNNATSDVTVVNSIATFEGIATFNSTFIQKVVVVTTAGTLNLASGAIFHLEGNGVGYTVTLPNATINGTTVHIKNVGNTQKIVDPIYIDGDNTHTIKLDQNEAITLYWYSTGWWVSSIYGAVQIN
jgi:hypothetical protein